MATLQSAHFSKLGQRLTPSAIASLMTVTLENPDLLSLAAGFTDTATLPRNAVDRAIDRLFGREGPCEYLQYGPNQGRPSLRGDLTARLASQDGLADESFKRSHLFVTNGSQQALFLATQVICDPGDIVFVERPSYFVYLEMLKGQGIEARSLPETPDGELDEAAFGDVLESMKQSGEIVRAKAVYLVSYFSNPSGGSRSESEKRGIARAIMRAGTGLAVIEDAAYRDLYYQCPYPARSVLALEEFEELPCLYLGTLTKPFATGLKVGYGYCSDEDWLQRILWLKGHHDFGSANFNQAVFEEIFAANDLDGHLPGIRRAYEEKMLVLHEVLEIEGLHQLGWSWRRPQGGLYLWLTAPESVDCSPESGFWKASVEEGVLYVPGSLCFGDHPGLNTVRLSFGVLDIEELREAGRRFVRAASKFR